MRKKSDTDYMKETLALAAAHSRSGRNGPFAAMVVKEGCVAGCGGNEVVRRRDPSAHAEIVAIRRACRALGSHELRGCTLYSSCEPCPMCLAAAYWSRLDRIVFACTRDEAAAAGFDDAAFYRELALPIEARALPATRVLARQGRKILDDWTRNPNRILY